MSVNEEKKEEYIARLFATYNKGFSALGEATLRIYCAKMSNYTLTNLFTYEDLQKQAFEEALELLKRIHGVL